MNREETGSIAAEFPLPSSCAHHSTAFLLLWPQLDQETGAPLTWERGGQGVPMPPVTEGVALLEAAHCVHTGFPNSLIPTVVGKGGC